MSYFVQWKRDETERFCIVLHYCSTNTKLNNDATDKQKHMLLLLMSGTTCSAMKKIVVSIKSWLSLFIVLHSIEWCSGVTTCVVTLIVCSVPSPARLLVWFQPKTIAAYWTPCFLTFKSSTSMHLWKQFCRSSVLNLNLLKSVCFIYTEVCFSRRSIYQFPLPLCTQRVNL